jgi:hypothetical protein
VSNVSDQKVRGGSWERRAADLANDVQRWLIKQSARNMRDELGDQVKKAFRGQGRSRQGDIWSTATTEPPDAADQPPECAWCPICRAARRMAQAQGVPSAATTPGAAAPKDAAAGLAGAADVLFGAARDALAGLDTILSYRPGDASADKAGTTSSADPGERPPGTPRSADPGERPPGTPRSANDATSDRPKEPDHEPDHRS